MNNPETFRPKSGYIFAGVVAVIFVGIFVQLVIEGDIKAILVGGGFAGFACTSAYLIYIRPKFVVFDEGFTIVNPLRSYTMGWEHVDKIDTKFSLEIFSNGKKLSVFAAPAPSRYHARTIKIEDVKGMGFKEGENIRAGDSPRSHSGVAAHLARTKLKAFKAAKSGGSGIPLSTRFNYIGAAVLLASVVLLFL